MPPSKTKENSRFPHPFQADPLGTGWPELGLGLRSPRTLLELKMCRLSAHIRQKPRWWEKMRDEAIRARWIREAKEQQAQLRPWERLTESMLNYVMNELEGYAKLRDPKTGIECGPYEGIYISDTLIPQDVEVSLKTAVRSLEDVPDDEKDWHPGSDGRVLDLVHPSICPLIFHETWGTDDDGTLITFGSPDEKSLGVQEMFISERFQWLPSDFAVAADGAVSLMSPYINNIPPKHHDALVPVVERVMTHAIPLWERVLSALRRGEHPDRVKRRDTPRNSYDADFPVACIWGDEGAHTPYGDSQEGDEDEDISSWLERKYGGSLVLPDAPAEYKDTFNEELSTSLTNTRIQVIVKLANIVLTPEKPEYPGGIWHVEGMATESIVSTFIYYYESENIESCNLSFRMATCYPGYHEQDDSVCMTVLYGISRDDPCVQDIGSAETKAGRCIAFPNIYQHRVSPFRLADPSKPGVRKILVFFLVDPTTMIWSTDNVPPQQLELVQDTLTSEALNRSSRLALLPVELLHRIARLVPGVKSRAEAEAIREELMEERSIMIESVNKEYFAREFNMCEH
ncbi:hypothetical protein GGX14DRAFT_644910 [Mycena pura]|uniref:Uncharacterized protein n=1 Tax=Mycena pura TaxID=153505 RepID=A0AAD6VBR0_9AGAR|nr:hypothetical protein GGX14DRAFT_644910 [Mycena pura]